MPRIITVTPNTAIDDVIRVSQLQPGEVIQARASHRYPAGKGVNVARTVASLGEAVMVLGVVGGESVPLFQAFRSDLIETKFITVPGETRTNISISEEAGSTVTHIRTPGYLVADSAMERLADLLREMVQVNDVVVLAGSLPRGAETSTYAILADICLSAGAKVILDTSGPALKAGIPGQPYMIKPNVAELEELTGKPVGTNDEKALVAILTRLQIRLPLVVLSRGAHGVLVRKHGDPVIRKAVVPLPAGKRIVNNVGCGDALVAGFAMGLIQQQSLDFVIRLGVACGTANLFTEIPGVCEPETVGQLMEQVHITSFS